MSVNRLRTNHTQVPFCDLIRDFWPNGNLIPQPHNLCLAPKEGTSDAPAPVFYHLNLTGHTITHRKNRYTLTQRYVASRTKHDAKPVPTSYHKNTQF